MKISTLIFFISHDSVIHRQIKPELYHTPIIGPTVTPPTQPLIYDDHAFIITAIGFCSTTTGHSTLSLGFNSVVDSLLSDWPYYIAS